MEPKWHPLSSPSPSPPSPPSSSLLLSHRHDFSSLVSWPHHWQPESFKTTMKNTSIVPSDITQIVPEHITRAKIAGENSNVCKDSRSEQKHRSQRSSSTTLRAISVACDADTSIGPRNTRLQQSASNKSATLTTANNITSSHSISPLTNAAVIPSCSLDNHEMNITHEKSNKISSTSTTSIPNKPWMTTTTGAYGATLESAKPVAIEHRLTSFDGHRSTRDPAKSVLEHLVLVFPEIIRRIQSGPENLTLRADEGHQSAEPVDLGEPPSHEEIKSWSESFDKLMMSLAGRHYFREFLRSEYSEENFLFWMSCESLKNEQNPDIIEEKARLIYENYISILSPKEVSLDSRVREVINKNMVEPSPHTFDEAQLQIYTLMHRDSYPRFINSYMYRRLLQKEDVKS